ncbi:MAG: glycoside hydrolase family 43 protein [Deinococcota bacterium]|jgi:beta-xylosidase|nr:glycoside hydrolase family 43 protein [Deinococcota bacterium]
MARSRRVLLALLLALGCALAQETFQNPVLRNNFPDPHLIRVDGVFYAYATNSMSMHVPVSRSSDLVNWDIPRNAMPALAPWVRLNRPDVWAPEVLELDGRYLLYYTARDRDSGRQCIGVAMSDEPGRWFRDESERPLVCQVDEGGSIDASPFADEDGTLYLLWKNDGNCCGMATYLYVQEMTPDGLGLVGEPARLIRNDKPWEGRVVEAPTMWLQDGRYYLFYSGNSYAGHEYAVGYAVCETATGPCQEATENPILSSVMTERPPIVGPGHQTITLDDEGQTWLVYHVWEVTSAGLRGERRLMWLDRLEWEEGRPVVQGPTRGPQPAPAIGGQP